LVTTLIMM